MPDTDDDRFSIEMPYEDALRKLMGIEGGQIEQAEDAESEEDD